MLAVEQDWILSNGRDFRFGIDKNESHGSGESVLLKSVVPRPKEFGFIAKTILPGDYLGKHVKMSAWVKTQLPEGASVQLWLKAHGEWKERPECFDNMFKRRIKGSRDWCRCEVEIEVPNDTTKIVYGILLNGTGYLWMDEISFEITESAAHSFNK